MALQVEEVARYSRQLILPGFGVQAQTKLKHAKVLVIGAGGLGCPSVQYLAAGGVGHITVVDADSVESSNLARQILHTDSRVGMNKAASIAAAVSVLNPFVHVTTEERMLTRTNAVALLAAHDIALDCTDNVMTRYLISDAAVLAGKQVVSGAAQGYDGQMVVLNKVCGEGVRGPCYRCLFPHAPKPDHTANCDDGGILGAVTGLVGTMQALEAIKLLTGLGEATQPTLTFVSPFSTPQFRAVRVRPRQAKTCRACGDPALVPDKIAALDTQDYSTFCGLARKPQILPPIPRVLPAALQAAIEERYPLIVDVRPAQHFCITAVPNSHNIPIEQVRQDAAGALASINATRILVVCRRGNDSQEAVRLFQSAAPDREFADVIGGLQSYAQFEPTFPMY
ncbi:Uba4p [Malassezia vespertilionis]|uniref:Uba4p n=1 Tax=Malassezia vespertilionis TaxID=2020962 RepID=A0A2N1JGJ3_9BASI|nr:Uba4p [Malassezia vespertilionis]